MDEGKRGMVCLLPGKISRYDYGSSIQNLHFHIELNMVVHYIRTILCLHCMINHFVEKGKVHFHLK